jgi:imidazole glycerol-phosphate synthase subunit HisH
MICIIDYGLGNVGSILNICKRVGIQAVLSNNEEVIRSSSQLILPGVGTFDTGMQNLNKLGLQELLTDEVVRNRKQILGICLGAQLMLESSEEGGKAGLGWIKGKCKKFETTNRLKVPHMGWNSLNVRKDEDLFKSMPYYPPRFYFVHSYHFCLNEESDILTTTVYDKEFISGFRKDNITGFQFHPEKSHKFGMQLLLNFSMNR